MRCVVSSFWLPRHGSPVEQYEDAFFPRRTGVRTGARLRLAVADGASESMLSGLWADLLATTWGRSRRRGADDVVEIAMSAWHGALACYLDGRKAERRPIEWFEQPGLDRGAHATLLGVELHGPSRRGGDGRWTAVSLGDSCVFHVRDDALLRSFPLEDVAEFSNAPKLVPTTPGHLGRVVSSLDTVEGTWRAGDLLFLTTDAVAAWFLAGAAAGEAPWRFLAAIERNDYATFEAWAGDQRSCGRLRNDDLTVLRVEFAGVRRR